MGYVDGLAELTAAPLEPGGIFVQSMPWLRIFPGEPRQLGLMRLWLTSLLVGTSVRDDVVSVATELSANAIRHIASGDGGCFAVEITSRPLVLRVAVADGGAIKAPTLLAAGPGDETGRGLKLVRGLTARVGVCGDHLGRLVWADVPLDPSPGDCPAYGTGEQALRQLRDDGFI